MNIKPKENSLQIDDAEDALKFMPVENFKRRTLVGPWRNVAEFNKVYDWLFGPQYSVVTRQQALGQIRIWNLRRSTQCPAAVLATGAIIEVLQKDHPETIYHNEILQTLYANAFTRFFNFMSSIMQTHNMRTMYETAKELGLESYVVDLRHMCAHGQVLPPLRVLRNAAEYCVEWLHDYYWAVQSSTMCDVDATRIRRKEKTAFDDEVSALFDIYDAALEGHMKGATNIKTLKRHLHGKRLHKLRDYYNNNNLKSLQQTFDCVVMELCCLVKREQAIKDIAEIYVGALLRMRYFFTLTGAQESQKQVESLLGVTQTLFRMLAIYGFLDDFFTSLIEITENPLADIMKRKAASFWAVEVVKGFIAFRKCKQMYKAEMDVNSTIKEPPFNYSNISDISEGTRVLMVYSGVGMKRTLLFGNHFRRPWVWVFERSFLEERIEVINEYTAPIIQNLLPLIVPELTASEIETISKLIKCLFEDLSEKDAKNESKKLNTDDSIYTAEDLLRKLRETHENEMEVDNEDIGSYYGAVLNNQKSYGLWSKVEDNDWKSCPLGRLPWEV